MKKGEEWMEKYVSSAMDCKNVLFNYVLPPSEPLTSFMFDGVF